MKKITNLTPHTVVFYFSDGTRKEILADGRIARVDVTAVDAGTFLGIPLRTTNYGSVIDLPDPDVDTMYIVSALVRSACPNRTDLASPADLVRDAEGRIIGCKALDINKGV